MVTIKKGNEKRLVPRGVYEEHYKQSGWKIVNEIGKVEKKGPALEAEEETDDDEDDDEDEYIDLDAMSFKELEAYAEELGIEETYKSKAEYKKVIEEYLEEEE